MKKATAVISSVCWIFQLIFSTTVDAQATGDDKALITRIEQEWIKAEFAQDTASIAKLLDRSFISIEGEYVMDRHQELLGVYEAVDGWKKGHQTVDSFELEQMLINIYDHTAVTTFICITHGKYDQTPYTRKSRFYDVLVKKEGVWRAVASHVIQGLPTGSAGYNEVKQKSALWNTSFNTRDSLAFYSLFDTSAIFISGGARRIGKEECKSLFRKLYTMRPDILLYNSPSGIEVNDQWHVAFETGNWTERWTEKGDKDPSQLKGKYCIMWKYTDGDWRITSVTLTPLSCTGSYCNKK